MTAQKTPVYCVYDDSRHSPLALGMIVAHAKSYKGGALMDSYEFIPTPLVSEEVARTITSEYGAGVLLCSNYVWNSSNNLRISRSVKKWHPRSLTIHGGPSVPKYEDACARFLAEHPAVDVTARGEGEVTAAEVLERLAAAGGHDPSNLDPLSDVAGLTFRQYMHGRRPELCRTPDRPRVDDVESLPSPYLSSWFRDDDASNWRAAIVETNRGCPYGCTFCDWGSATLSKIRKFSIERVQGELEWIAQRRVPTVWIADANFGIFDRDVAIAKMLGDMKRQYGYPRQVILTYAKNATERLADIIATLHEAEINSQGVISIQTQDEKTLAVINRSNIKTKRYDELVTIFRERGLPVSSELMVGLPGSTVDSFKADLQFFVNRRVFARVYPTIVLPNSPMAERSYMEKYAIKIGRASCRERV